jgi:hypothetical protein
VRLAGDERPSEGAPKEEREYRNDGAVGRKRTAAGRKSGNTALTARSAGKGRPPEGAPEKEREYRLVRRRLEGRR